MNFALQRGTAFQEIRPTMRDDHDVVFYAGLTNWRVIDGFNQSVWLKELEGRFNELTSLSQGWDGYVGQPVSFSVASFAANLLARLCLDIVPPPSLVPGSDGTLQIEWHRNGYDVEIDVLGTQNIVASRFDHKTQTEELIELQSDFAPIADWIRDLANDREVQRHEMG